MLTLQSGATLVGYVVALLVLFRHQVPILGTHSLQQAALGGLSHHSGKMFSFGYLHHPSFSSTFLSRYRYSLGGWKHIRWWHQGRGQDCQLPLAEFQVVLSCCAPERVLPNGDYYGTQVPCEPGPCQFSLASGRVYRTPDGPVQALFLCTFLSLALIIAFCEVLAGASPLCLPLASYPQPFKWSILSVMSSLILGACVCCTLRGTSCSLLPEAAFPI